MSRHRKHKQQADATMIGRMAKLKAYKAELAQRSGLSESDVRVEQCAWALLGADVLREAILRGEPVALSALQPATEMLLKLLPPKGMDLNVNFIGDCKRCPQCGYVGPQDPDEIAADLVREQRSNPHLAPPPLPTPAPCNDAQQPGPPEQPDVAEAAPAANIVPLRNAAPAPAPAQPPKSLYSMIAEVNASPNAERRGPNGWDQWG